MADDVKKYVSSENLSYMLQQLKTKLDETYFTVVTESEVGNMLDEVFDTTE